MDNKFSIIGTGFILPRHIQAIAHIGGEIIDVVNDKRGKYDWSAMVETTKADYISILTPNDLHFKMIEKAHNKGKTVLCEKPICILPEDFNYLLGYDNVFTVLQLRHHLLVKEIEVKDFNEIEVDISVYRDKSYYNSWKGDSKRSGGILYNLGIHYFDLLTYLFGNVKKIDEAKVSDKEASGIIQGDNFKCKFYLTTDAKQNEQKRIFKINGRYFNFSSQDNLSFEDLHKFVYEDLIRGKGVRPTDIKDLMFLIEAIKEYAG